MKKQKLPPLVRFAIFTAVTTMAWVAFDVYRAFTIKPTPIVSQEILAPVDPVLDALTLDRLQNRIHLSDTEIGDTAISTLPGEDDVLVEEETDEIAVLEEELVDDEEIVIEEPEF